MSGTTIRSIDTGCFSNNRRLTYFISNTRINISCDTFRNNASLKSIVCKGAGIAYIRGAVQTCPSLRTIEPAFSPRSSLAGSWYAGYFFRRMHFTTLGGANSIYVNMFRSAIIETIIIDSGITGFSGFINTRFNKLYMRHTTPPTLSSTSTFVPYAYSKIYVPTGTLSAYQEATNWADLSDYMEEKEWDTQS